VKKFVRHREHTKVPPVFLALSKTKTGPVMVVGGVFLILGVPDSILRPSGDRIQHLLTLTLIGATGCPLTRVAAASVSRSNQTIYIYKRAISGQV